MAVLNIVCAWSFIFASLYLICVVIAAMWGVTSGMARITLGPNVTDIRGRFGSIVYSIWKTGVQYMRQVANVISNPGSDDQAAIRNRMTLVSKRWYDVLTDDQRAGWNDWAQTKPGMGNGDGGIYNIIKGNGGIMSGINAYVMANAWLVSIGAPIVDGAPLGLTPPSAPTSLNAAYAGGVVTVTWVEPVTHKAQAKIRIWLIHHQQVVHKQLVAVTSVEDETLALSQVKGALGNPANIANYPGEYAIQADTVDVDGTKSPGSNVAAFAVV